MPFVLSSGSPVRLTDNRKLSDHTGGHLTNNKKLVDYTGESLTDNKDSLNNKGAHLKDNRMLPDYQDHTARRTLTSLLLSPNDSSQKVPR